MMFDRRLLVAACFLLASMTASQAVTSQPEFYSSVAILKWINSYRSKPNPMRAAAAIHELSQLGELHSQESAGVYVGFAAGVLAANPSKADALIDKMLPMPPEDQWLVVRAIAYSGIPQWRQLLARIAPKVPARGPMLQKYIAGKLPVMTQFRLNKPQEGWLQRTTQLFTIASKPKEKPVVLQPSPELLDTFWGYYFATGDSTSLQHIISLLSWSKNRDEVDKLTLGSMAKYTLAENASRDPVLLATLKAVRNSPPEDTRLVLAEVIEAADDVDVSRVRSEMLAALDELKRKGSAFKRNVGFWGKVGEGAIAAGCIAATVAGQLQFGIPCVVGGAVSSGAINLWSSQN